MLTEIFLQKQRQAEEQERLRKIQESIEMERKQKADEEKRIKEEEETRKRLVSFTATIFSEQNLIRSFYYTGK